MAEPTYEDLRAENRQLREENARLKGRGAELERVVEDLRALVEQLRQELEKSQRAAKRQAAPFSKRTPKAAPKRPGRKPGPDYGRHEFRQGTPITVDGPLAAYVQTFSFDGHTPEATADFVPAFSEARAA